ncbi:metallopeptidase TldD-related protein [Bacillus thuringiensis]
MNEIRQVISEYTMKYNKGHALFDHSIELGKKQFNDMFMESYGTDKFICGINHQHMKVLENNKTQLEKYLCAVDNELSKAGKSLTVYIKERYDEIYINSVSDSRQYRVVRVVIRNTDSLPYIKESYPNSISLESIVDLVKQEVNFTKNQHWQLDANKVQQKTFSDIRIILKPKASGFFFHEAIGHLLEKDIYDYIKKDLEDITFSSFLKIIDNPQGFENFIGLNKIDDLGTAITPIKLIENGQILNIISTSNGFARAEKYDYPILPRMRMLKIEPCFDFEMDNDGIVITDIHSGQVIPAKLTFHLKGRGYIRKNGIYTAYIDNLEVIGSLKKGLKNLDYIGNDNQTLIADCIKKNQTVRVGVSSPTISISNQTVKGLVYE